MTLKEAFEDLTKEWGWYKKCTNNGKPLKASTAQSFKKLFKEGKLTEVKMSSLLLSANYKVIPAQWSAPNTQKNENIID